MPTDALTAGTLSVGSPQLDALPAFTSANTAHFATALTTGSPVLDTPTLVPGSSTSVSLAGTPIRIGAVIPEVAATAPTGLSPNTLTTSSPVLGRPAITATGPQAQQLVASALATTAPTFTRPAIGQKHVLPSGTPFVGAAPVLGHPTVGSLAVINDLFADGFLTDSPEFGLPAFSEIPIALPGVVGPTAQLVTPPIATEDQPFPDRHVRRIGDDYAESLAYLLPTGRAWSRDENSVIMRVVRGLAQIWGRVDARAADLLERESDPRTTIELLTDWERNWGLPDPCFFGEPQTVGDRQKMLLTKMTLEGAQSREFFIWAALQLGYHITITEFSPFMVGVSHVGDTRVKDTTPNMITGPLGIFG